MSSGNEEVPNLDDVIEPHDDALPRPNRGGHAKAPDRLDDDALQDATEQERADAGLIDYAPADVPPATDPAPPGTSDEALRAQQGLTEEDDANPE